MPAVFWYWLVILSTLGLFLAGVICAILRVRRVIAIRLLALTLLPLAFGVVGMVAGQAESARVIREIGSQGGLKVTPSVWAAGEISAELRLMQGLMGMLVSYVPVLVAFARSRGQEQIATPGNALE
jgi:hypothetical protein